MERGCQQNDRTLVKDYEAPSTESNDRAGKLEHLRWPACTAGIRGDDGGARETAVAGTATTGRSSTGGMGHSRAARG